MTEPQANGRLSEPSADKAEIDFPLKTRRPELEDVRLVKSGWEEAKKHAGERAAVDLYYGTVKEGMSKWSVRRAEVLLRNGKHT